MGLLGKLMFWKKGDEFIDSELGNKSAPAGMDLGLGPEIGPGASIDQGYGMQPSPGLPSSQQPMQPLPFNPPNFSQPPAQPQMQPQAPPQDYAMSKNIEVVSSKLDALRASLDSINQRLANLEAIARGEEDNRYKRRW